ncbi:MAG: hypothetical protein H7Y11_04995, partial [Armatimonadetes bacterium]|nr:hypothetical protein [Anaerolineae bacterium]
LGGCIVALLLLTLLLLLFPGLILGATSYAERSSANQQVTVAFKPSDGDLFVALPGSIRPPDDDTPQSSFTVAWDADGFRLPAQPAATYPIAVFGDSFTEGFNVPTPYADGLAALLGVGVRNYGYRAYGPAEVAQAAEQVAGVEARQWVLYGYFSGNDLGDAVRPPKIDTRSPVAVWDALLTKLRPRATLQPSVETPHYDFPMPVIIGGQYYELAFLWYYWWWQRVPTDAAFAESQNFAVVGNALDTIVAASPGACRALIFIPTKEQLYYRYIYDTERRWVLENAHKLALEATDNTLQLIPAPLTPADDAVFAASLTGQRDAIAALVAQHPGWVLIDLTPTFEAAVGQGALLYYPYDSHWNQAGHDLAVQTIAAWLRAAPSCTLAP